MGYTDLRHQVWDGTMTLFGEGQMRQSCGNVSARGAEGEIPITPADEAYDESRPEWIPVLDGDGRVLEGSPSPLGDPEEGVGPGCVSLRRRDCPREFDLRHGPGGSGAGDPPIGLELVALGAAAPAAEFACPVMGRAGEAAAAKLRSPSPHGAVDAGPRGLAIGPAVEAACRNALALETGIQVYHPALETGRRPPVVIDDQVAEIRAMYVKA